MQNSLLFLDSSATAHGTPLTVFCFTAGIMILNLWVLGVMLLLGTIRKTKLAAVMCCLALTAAGGAAIFYDGRLMWLFPLAHLEYGAHYHAIYAETVFPVSGSVGYLAAWLVGAIVLCFGSLPYMQPERTVDGD